jgi:adenosylhomocysteine nucleosidase
MSPPELELAPPGSPLIVLLAALPDEISGLRRQMHLASRAVPGLRRPAYTGLYHGRPVLVARTGMGRERAEAGLAALLARYRVAAVISIGFSGALDGSLAVGDLVLPTELSVTTPLPAGTEVAPGDTEVAPSVLRPDRDLLHAAAEALRPTLLRVVSGPTVTTLDIATTPAERQRLASQTGAVAVDMESYWLAKMASARDLPFLALRAISDTQDDRLLPFDQLADAYGETSLPRLVAYLLRKPGSLAAVVSLARNAGRARRALTAGVAQTCCSIFAQD